MYMLNQNLKCVKYFYICTYMLKYFDLFYNSFKHCVFMLYYSFLKNVYKKYFEDYVNKMFKNFLFHVNVE